MTDIKICLRFVEQINSVQLPMSKFRNTAQMNNNYAQAGYHQVKFRLQLECRGCCCYGKKNTCDMCVGFETFFSECALAIVWS